MAATRTGRHSVVLRQRVVCRSDQPVQEQVEPFKPFLCPVDHSNPPGDGDGVHVPEAVAFLFR